MSSLFPAYQIQAQKDGEPDNPSGKTEDCNEPDWLRNQSYVENQGIIRHHDQTDVASPQSKAPIESSDVKIRRKKVKKPGEPPIFVKDVQGDSGLLKLSTLPIRQTPHYKLRWKHSVLTESGILKSLLSQHKTGREGPVRYFSKKFQRKFLKAESTKLEMRPEKGAPIAVGATQAFVRFLIHDDYGRTGSTQGQAIDMPDSFKQHEIQLRTKQFNEQLRLRPNDEALWLEYVDFQDTALLDSDFQTDGQESGSAKTKKVAPVIRRRAVVEKQLAVIKAALKHNPHSIALNVKRLHLSKEIIDLKSLDVQWKELLSLYPNQIDLWKNYLSFLRSSSCFTMDKMTGALKRCLAVFRQMADSPQSTYPQIETHIRQVILCVAHLWANAGYREKGVALFQALIELNLFSPAFPGFYSLDHRLASFEQFWESKAPRFGDQGATGWKVVMQTRPQIIFETMDNVSSGEDALLSRAAGSEVGARELLQLWSQIEIMREQEHFTPWRSPEDESDDPDRMVSFDDISPFLYRFVEYSGSDGSGLILILNFLQFMGLDLAELMDQLDYDFQNLTTQYSTQVLITTDIIDTFPQNVDPLLKLSSMPQLNRTPMYSNMLRNIFLQGIDALKGSAEAKAALSSLWMMFEVKTIFSSPASDKKQRTKQLKKQIKDLLAQDKDNMVLYIPYAVTMFLLDGKVNSTSRPTFQTLLTATNGDSYFYRCAIVCELSCKEGQVDTEYVMWLLILAATGQPFRSMPPQSGISLLSMAQDAQQFVCQQLSTSAAAGQHIHSANDVGLVTFRCSWFDKVFFAAWLLTLLREDADAVLQESLCRCGTEKTQWTLCREHLVKLRLCVHRFKQQHSTLPHMNTLWHHIFLQGMSDYPCSPYMMRTLMSYMKQQHFATVANPFWRSVDQLLSGCMHPIGTVALVHIVLLPCLDLASGHPRDRSFVYEQSLDFVADGFLNRAVFLLDRLLQDDRLKRVTVLWRMLMATTKAALAGNKTINAYNQVKRVFYRAIQECPFSKMLYLDVVSEAIDDPDNQSALMDEVQGLLREKGIRVRIPVEELRVLLDPEELDD